MRWTTSPLISESLTGRMVSGELGVGVGGWGWGGGLVVGCVGWVVSWGWGVQSWFVITLWINIMMTFLINLLLRCVTHLFGFKKINKTLFNSNVIGHIKLAKPYFSCPNMRTPVIVDIVIYFFDTHLNEFGFMNSRHCWLSDWLNGISVVQIRQHCCLGLIFFYVTLILTNSLLISLCKTGMCLHRPLTRYVKLWVAHTPGMPGTLCFPRHRLKRQPLVSDRGMHHGTCITHVPWCMSRSLTHGGGENVPGIPGACTTRNFTYLARGPFPRVSLSSSQPLRVSEISVVFN